MAHPLLQPFLEKQYSDPLHRIHSYGPSKRARRLQRVAQAVQHYGNAAVRFVPRLFGVLPSEHENEVKSYTLCLVRPHKVVQAGDMVQMNKQRGIIQHFYLKDGKLVQVVVRLLREFANLPVAWQALNAESLPMLTDHMKSYYLGEIDAFTPKAKVQISEVEWRQGRLYQRDQPLVNKKIQALVDGYITCRKSLLAKSPLVQEAALYLNVFKPCQLLTRLIVQDFGLLKHDFERVHTEAKELAEIKRCNCCKNTKQTAYQDQTMTLCELCYVKLRNLYPVFQVLEGARKYLKQHPAGLSKTWQKQIEEDVLVPLQNLF